MARLLLKRWGARLLFAALLPSMYACIIPVAPDFQDPLAASNTPPYLQGCLPSVGAVVSILSNDKTTFKCTVTDPNVQDRLFIRWIFDYPPAPGATTSLLFPEVEDLPPATGTSHTANPSFDLSCANISGLLVNVSTPQHLMMAVADRDFISDQTVLDKTDPGVYPQEVPWTVVFQCSGTP